MINIEERSSLKVDRYFKKEQKMRREKNKSENKIKWLFNKMLDLKDFEELRRVFEEKQKNKKVFKGDGIKEWYGDRRKQDILVEVKRMGQGNVFDLLSIVFRLKLDEKQITCEQIVCFYQSLLDRTSRKHEIYMGIGNAYFNIGWYEIAEKSFLEALQFRQTEKVYESLLMVSVKQFNTEKGMIYISKCLQINENNSCAYFWKLTLQGKDSIQKFSQENPSYYFVYFYRAFVETNHKLKEKLLRKVAQYNPSYPYYNIQIANELQYPWVSIKLLVLTKKYSDNYYYFVKLGGKEFKKLHYKESVQYFEQALLCDPYDCLSTQRLGISYHHLKQYQQAIKCYKKALELNPSLLNSRISLIDIYQKDKAKQQQKLSIAREGLKFFPQNTFFLQIVATNLIDRGCFSQALQFLVILHPLKPNGKVEDMISKCLLSLGDIKGVSWAFSSISKGGIDMEQILHRTIKFMKHGKKYLLMLKWFVQLAPMVLNQDDSCSKIPLTTLLDFIKTNCVRYLSRSLIQKFIEKKRSQLSQNIDNRLTFLVMGKIFLELEQFEKSAVLFNIIKKLSKKNEPIYIEIDMFFGDRQNGIISYEERDKRKQFRDRFTTSFELEYKKAKNDEMIQL